MFGCLISKWLVNFDGFILVVTFTSKHHVFTARSMVYNEQMKILISNNLDNFKIFSNFLQVKVVHIYACHGWYIIYVHICYICMCIYDKLKTCNTADEEFVLVTEDSILYILVC